MNTAWSAAPLDLKGLRALDANLNLTIGALKFQRMSFADVALGLRVANGAADARLTRISLYQGSGVARLIADGSGPTARVAVELDARDIQAEPLLRDAIGFEKIAGRGRLVIALVGQGASQAALMRALNGTASFNFNDGQWKGVNLAQVARTVQALATGAAAGEGSATDFAELAASFRVANGVAVTDDLRLLNPFVRLDGAGLVDIGGQSIDIRIAPRAVRSAQGQGGDASLQGLGVPFRVSGPWANVKFQPALGDVVQNELRNRAQQALRGQAPGSPLATLGEALFGRTPTAPTPSRANRRRKLQRKRPRQQPSPRQRRAIRSKIFSAAPRSDPRRRRNQRQSPRRLKFVCDCRKPAARRFQVGARGFSPAGAMRIEQYPVVDPARKSLHSRPFALNAPPIARGRSVRAIGLADAAVWSPLQWPTRPHRTAKPNCSPPPSSTSISRHSTRARSSTPGAR